MATKKTTTKKATKKTTTKKATAKATKKVTKKTTTKAKAAAAPKATKVKAAPKKAAVKSGATKVKRKPNPAFMRPLNPSRELARIVGERAIPRTEVVKKLWEYIRKNHLQDTKNKRNINADENLRAIFEGKKSVSMFEMTKYVSKHLS